MSPAVIWSIALGILAVATFAAWIVRRECGTGQVGERVLLYMAGALCVLGIALIVGAGPLHAASIAALAVLCAAIVETDARLNLIPDTLVAPVAAIALAMPNALPLTDKIVSALLLGLLFLAVRQAYEYWRKEEGLGLGDVKLAMAMGAVLGAERALIAVAAAAAITAGYVLWRMPREDGAPFGVGLAAATAAAALVGAALA